MENSCATIELPAFYVTGGVIYCHRTQVISSDFSESTGVACTTAGSACNPFFVTLVRVKYFRSYDSIHKDVTIVSLLTHGSRFC